MMVTWSCGRFRQQVGYSVVYTESLNRVKGLLIKWVKGRLRQQVGYIVYMESLKRVKGFSYDSDLVMWVKGRFPTAGWIQFVYTESLKRVKGCSMVSWSCG